MISSVSSCALDWGTLWNDFCPTKMGFARGGGEAFFRGSVAAWRVWGGGTDVRWDVDPGGEDSVSDEWKGMCRGTLELEGGGGEVYNVLCDTGFFFSFCTMLTPHPTQGKATS
jgi:hypothetical protein